jgi:hypothetical protein
LNADRSRESECLAVARDFDGVLYPLAVKFKRLPRTQVKKGLFTASECGELVRLAEDKRFYRSGGKRIKRSVEICYVYPHDAEWAYEKLARVFVEKNVWNFALTAMVEPVRIQRYATGGYTRAHSDYDCGTSDRSKITAIVPLVERRRWRGGRLVIGEQSVTPRLERGDCLLFQSFAFHGVSSVTAGVRIVLSAWAAGPALV